MMLLGNKALSQRSSIALAFSSFFLMLFCSCHYFCSEQKSAEEEFTRDEKVLDDFHKDSETAAFTKAVKDSVSRSISDSMDLVEKDLESQSTDVPSSKKLKKIEKQKLKEVEKPKVKAAPAPETYQPAKEEVAGKRALEQQAKEIKEEPRKGIEKKVRPTRTPGPATASSPGNTFLLMGHAAFKEKSYRAATIQLKKAVEADPNLFLAHYWLGRAYIERGRHHPAVKALEKAIATRSEEDRDIDVEKYLAWEYVESEQYGKAIVMYRQRVEADPGNLEDHFGLAFALKGAGNLDEAAQAYRKAIEINPDIASIHFNLANTLSEMNSMDEAIEEYKTATALKPGYGKAYFNLGMALEKVGKPKEAIEAFNKCLELGHSAWQAKRRIKAILKDMEGP